MKAVTMSAFGGVEVLKYEEIPAPKPGPGSVLVRVEAVGANYYDTLVRSGAVSHEIALPHIFGSDIVGEIFELGPDVTGWTAGQRVIVAPGYPSDPKDWAIQPENQAPSYYPTGTFSWGGYAQFVEVPARWLLPDDTGMAPEELATIPLVLVTAVHAVKTRAQVGRGSRVLVQAGASGSGSMAIQVAKALGADVVATVSTGEKAAVARRAGADEVIHYKENRVPDAVHAWTRGEGVDVVIDPVGGVTLGDSLESLKPRGVIVNLGLTGGVQATVPNLYSFFRNEKRIVGSWMGSMDELRFGLDLVRQGKVRATLQKSVPLASAIEVHQMIAAHAIAGKVSLQPWAS